MPVQVPTEKRSPIASLVLELGDDGVKIFTELFRNDHQLA